MSTLVQQVGKGMDGGYDHSSPDPRPAHQMTYPSPTSKQQFVSNVQNRKRLNTYDTSQDSPPTKRIKSASAAANFPPKFWNNLSKVWLTPRALREKDRQNGARPPATVLAASVTPTTLARFARRGGPDLRHLRGYPEPKQAAPMSSNHSSMPLSRRSTKATTASSKVRRSSAYDKDFEQNLIDHGIYPEGFQHTDGRLTPEPSNLDEVARGLSNHRASLSPSQFSNSAFKSFKLANSRVISEGKVMTDILPIIRGNTDIPSEGNLPFTNLDSMTDGTTVDVVPDLYDGSHATEISKTVRQELSKTVIPTNHGRAPVAPNFFMEVKAPRGGVDVAKRQACLDGAVGARAMHSLQTYGKENPSYDGNAYTFSSTYVDGLLKMYTHHVTAPTAEGEQPEYHMTQIDAWAMTGNIDTFRRGATALRNARDLARRQRGTFIQEANARLSPAQQVITGDHISDAFEDHSSYRHIDHSEITAWQDSHDDLQQHITETCAEDSENNGEATTPLQHHYSSKEPQDPGQNLAASGADESCVSSFTSNFSTDTTRPKRPRESFSSPTQGSRLSKSRSRPTATERPVNSPTAATKLELSGPGEPVPGQDV